MTWIRPSAKEIEALAIKETTVAGQGAFAPICAGPVVAVFLLACVGAATAPVALWRVIRGALSGPDGD